VQNFWLNFRSGAHIAQHFSLNGALLGLNLEIFSGALILLVSYLQLQAKRNMGSSCTIKNPRPESNRVQQFQNGLN